RGYWRLGAEGAECSAKTTVAECIRDGRNDLATHRRDIERFKLAISGEFAYIAKIWRRARPRGESVDHKHSIVWVVVDFINVEGKIGVADRNQISQNPRKQMPTEYSFNSFRSGRRDRGKILDLRSPMLSAVADQPGK